MDLYFQGMACANKGSTPENFARASHFFEQALASDPANVHALVGFALADYGQGLTSLPDEQAALLARAEATVNKALSLAPEYALGHLVLARVQAFTNRALQAIAECERSLLLDRNLADAHAAIGWGKCVLGRAEETDAYINEAFRLSPRDTNAYRWMAIAAFAKLLLGYDDEAVALLRRAIETNRNFPRSHLWLGAALANLGRTEEARAVVKAGLSLDPSFTITRAFAVNDNPIYLAQRQRIVEGMRKAGVPEG